MKRWLKYGLIGAGIGFVISLIQLVLFFIISFNEGPSEAAGLAFTIILGALIAYPFTGFLVLGIVGFILTKLIDSNLTITKKGFWVGIGIVVLIGFFGISAAYKSAGLGHKKEYLIYTLIFSIVFFISPILIGWIIQMIKNKSNWQNWTYTKKGFIIGLITGIFAFVSWVIFTGYWMYTANKEFGDLINDPSFWMIPASFIAPIIICTILGLIVEKIKSNNNQSPFTNNLKTNLK